MHQLTLFDEPKVDRTYGVVIEAPYVKGSETSKEAAKKIDSVNNDGPGIGKRERQLLQLMQNRESYGVTESEVQELFQWSGDYQRPAMRSLLKNEFVEKTERKRINSGGNKCAVWIVTQAGMKVECGI